MSGPKGGKEHPEIVKRLRNVVGDKSRMVYLENSQVVNKPEEVNHLFKQLSETQGLLVFGPNVDFHVICEEIDKSSGKSVKLTYVIVLVLVALVAGYVLAKYMPAASE